MLIRLPLSLLSVLALLTACATPDSDTGSDALPPAYDGDATPQPPGQPAGGDAPRDFDREAHRAAAEALLGVAEDALEPAPNLRIARRGDERFALTMDLRPGRRNVELDEQPGGGYAVTRVIVETPDGSDSIVVE